MRKNESGRSMVEMLGVLAIIGVLSIGGIAGYTLSMNRYQANTGVDFANKLASLVYADFQTQMAGGASSYTTKDVDDYGLTVPTGWTFTIGTVGANGVQITADHDTDGVMTAYDSIANSTSGTKTFTQN